jgi:ribulose-phosphate 3-epimerase
MFLDCHLMMTNPGDYLQAFRDAGADATTVHVEIGGTEALVTAMRELGLGVGLAANPDTPFSAVEPYLDSIDLLLLMTVFPGFGGQHFMAEVVQKITQARRAIDALGLNVIVQVDGGIDEQTAAVTARAGARVFVAGTAVFHADRPWEAARRIHASAAVGARS